MNEDKKRNIFSAKRKNRFTEFPADKKKITIITFTLFFMIGLYISSSLGVWGVILYLGLWFLSFPVIYAGTCRYCVYYGKSCPIPLEGSCVHYFFEKKEAFGPVQFFWASVAYVMRICIPVYIIISQLLIFQGLLFLTAFALFWILQQYLSGCPNCINTTCPFNPDYD